MEELGLFCIGVFVGSIATVSLTFIQNASDWRMTLATVLPAVFSGVALGFVKRFRTTALGCYPLGLVIALMWHFMGIATTYLESGAGKKGLSGAMDFFLGGAQLLGTAALTAAAIVVAGIPAWQYIRNVWKSKSKG
ncbi:hypothetical protein SAMN02787142_7797 [Burkholderia sp. WP9]|uniref:hypothetical protein n=1 Tax=Burkholderia sp. WP9 TaxID=1500263 RepID=UPI0008964970|nr:hypothetical protein [Burkholderia sp. WP9]SEF11924.1 hypothetical protein SAMN02787142_7797 [Burkholderia sp. WP9]